MLDKLDRFHNCDYTLLVGRVLISLVFLIGATRWIIDISPPTLRMENAGWIFPQAQAYIALVLKMSGGLMVFLGFKTRLGALVLAVFTTIANFGFHFPPDDVFYLELSMIGGMLILATTGPGKFSLDAVLAARKKQ